MSARVYFMKGLKIVKMCLQCLREMNSEDGQVYSVCMLKFSGFTKYNRMQSKHKQNVNIADKTLTDYSFLSRYH